jgi:hypothetical protein
MKCQSKIARRALLVLGTVLCSLGASACTMLQAQGDSERIGKAEQIRCLRWHGQERGTLLSRSAAAEVRRVLAEVIVPLRAATPLTQGTALGTLTLEGPDGNLNIRFFSEPRWAEIGDRYYQLTQAELEAVRQAVEPSGPNLRGREYERIP